MDKPSTDAPLVAAARSGNLAAFETLVTRHGNRLFRQALGYLHADEDARDALQDAFLTSFIRLDALEDPFPFPVMGQPYTSQHLPEQAEAKSPATDHDGVG